MALNQDPFNFGDWESESEEHEHCVLTEDLCRTLAMQPSGHGPQCCTCDEAEMPQWIQHGCSTPDEFVARLEAKRDEIIAEGRGSSWVGDEELEQQLIKEINERLTPRAREAFLRRLGNPELIFQKPTYPSIYAEIAAREPAPRVISTASSPKHGSIIIAHKFLPDSDNLSCRRCGTPRENRLHRAGELPENNILKALKDAVSHECDFGCSPGKCGFDYRRAVRQVRRILKEV